MGRFVVGADRSQTTLFPECLDDWIDDDNSVRVVDAFVDALDLGELGFDGVVPEATGRPSRRALDGDQRSRLRRGR
jgi:transposase